MLTTTELIKILLDNEKGGISHRSRQISLTVNGRCLPEPHITLSSTGDGILGPEIWLDVDGEWLEPEADRADEVLDEIIERFEHSAEFERTHGNLMGCQEFKQLAEWLKELKAYKEQEPCADAISREAMLKYQQYLYGKMSNEENQKLWEFIKELPPVTPQNTERKTGEIITHYEIYIDREGFERRVKKTTYCSLCKWDLGYNGDLLTHYCPNCGMKLEYKGR